MERAAKLVQPSSKRPERKKANEKSKVKVAQAKKTYKEFLRTENATKGDSSMAISNAQKTTALRNYFKASSVEKRVYEWLVGLRNPHLPNMPGCPFGRAPGEIVQNYQVEITIFANANANGFVCVFLDPDNSYPDYTANNPLVSASSSRWFGTVANANAVWYTNSSYGAVTVPLPGSVVGAGILAEKLGGVGATVATIVPGATITNYYRCTSVGMYVQPTMTALSNSGSILLYQSTNYAYSNGLGMNPLSIMGNNSFSSLDDVPDSLASTQTLSIPEWPQDKEAVVTYFPSASCAYYPQSVIASAIQTSPKGLMGVVGSGLNSGAQIRVKTVMNFEFLAVPTFLASTMVQTNAVSASIADIPSAANLHMHTASMDPTRVIGAVDGYSPAAAAAHVKLANTPLPKAEATSWLGSLTSGIGTAVNIGSKLLPIVEEVLGFL